MSDHLVSLPLPIFMTDDLSNNAKDYLDLSLLPKAIGEKTSSEQRILRVESNVDFWNMLLEGRPYSGKKVQLVNFGLLEWLPASPGLFFTEKANHLRNEALQRSEGYLGFNPGNPIGKKFVELRPDEKEGMVRGGFGSVRLASKTVDGRDIFFLGASSTMVSHEGIPIIVNFNIYETVMDDLSSNKITVADITGRLKLIPDNIKLAGFSYGQKIPKYCIEVEEIVPKSRIESSDACISVAITFSNGIKDFKNSQQYYSFCTFSPSNNQAHTKEAADWLKNYAVRYSESKDPLIFGDFDETISYYENVQLPLARIMEGKMSIEDLEMLNKFLHIEIHGDVFSNIQNSTIATRSTIDNSFNKTG